MSVDIQQLRNESARAIAEIDLRLASNEFDDDPEAAEWARAMRAAASLAVTAADARRRSRAPCSSYRARTGSLSRQRVAMLRPCMSCGRPSAQARCPDHRAKSGWAASCGGIESSTVGPCHQRAAPSLERHLTDHCTKRTKRILRDDQGQLLGIQELTSAR